MKRIKDLSVQKLFCTRKYIHVTFLNILLDCIYFYLFCILFIYFWSKSLIFGGVFPNQCLNPLAIVPCLNQRHHWHILDQFMLFMLHFNTNSHLFRSPRWSHNSWTTAQIISFIGPMVFSQMGCVWFQHCSVARCFGCMSPASTTAPRVWNQTHPRDPCAPAGTPFLNGQETPSDWSTVTCSADYKHYILLNLFEVCVVAKCNK